MPESVSDLAVLIYTSQQSRVCIYQWKKMDFFFSRFPRHNMNVVLFSCLFSIDINIDTFFEFYRIQCTHLLFLYFVSIYLLFIYFFFFCVCIFCIVLLLSRQSFQCFAYIFLFLSNSNVSKECTTQYLNVNGEIDTIRTFF